MKEQASSQKEISKSIGKMGRFKRITAAQESVAVIELGAGTWIRNSQAKRTQKKHQKQQRQNRPLRRKLERVPPEQSIN